MFPEFLYMFKSFKKSMWTSGFFVAKVIFPYQMFTKYIPQKGIHVFKTFKNKYTYTFLDFNTPFTIL